MGGIHEKDSFYHAAEDGLEIEGFVGDLRREGLQLFGDFSKIPEGVFEQAKRGEEDDGAVIFLHEASDEEKDVLEGAEDLEEKNKEACKNKQA